MHESRRQFLGRLFGKKSLRTLGAIAAQGMGTVRVFRQAAAMSAEEAGLALGGRRRSPVTAPEAGPATRTVIDHPPVGGSAAANAALPDSTISEQENAE